MNIKKNVRGGFTLIELIVVLGIMIALGGIVVVNLAGRKTITDLKLTTEQIATLLRQAQSDSMSQESGATWGVYFSNSTTTAPFYALFTTTYSPSNTVGYYRLPSTVAYSTSSLAVGSSTSITFSQIVGTASASTSIGFYMPYQSTAFSSTISVASSGEVSY